MSQLRYTDEELQLVKGVFAENDIALKALRKHFLQLPKNAVDLSILQGFKDDVLKVLRKTFLPEMDGDLPIGQNIDLWLTIKFDDKMLLESYHILKSREMYIEYIGQQLKSLEGGKEKIKFKDFEEKVKDKIPGDAFSDILCRNHIVYNVEGHLGQLKALAGLKQETLEEQKKRLTANSNK